MEFLINALPGVLPLIAAFIVCVISFVRRFAIDRFVIVFSVAVILFYIMGLVIRRILRKQYNEVMEAIAAAEELSAAESTLEEETKEVQQQ